MNPLPLQFEFDGFQFRQLKRDGDVVLLVKIKLTTAAPSYEVILVQHHPAQTISEREYPARESMPRSTA